MDKKPFISLKVRISIGVVSVCLLLGLLAVLLMNRIARDIVDEEYTDDAKKISKAVVSALDVGDVKELTDIVMGIYEEAGQVVPSTEWGSDAWNEYMSNYEGVEDLQVFNKLRKQLRTYQEIFDVEYIYIMQFNTASKHAIYIIDASYENVFENDRNICNLVLDDYNGGRQVGAYLRNQNCLKVLFVADNRLSPDFDRYTGLCDGLEGRADFWEIPMHKEERKKYYADRKKEFAGYGAVFAASDYYAIELLYFLMDYGYRVPDDIWVIGFDDIADCKNVRPTLSSVRQDVLYRARKAVKYLTYMKKDSDYSATEKIPVEFIPRGSCGTE